jgi:hypothetical protein
MLRVKIAAVDVVCSPIQLMVDPDGRDHSVSCLHMSQLRPELGNTVETDSALCVHCTQNISLMQHGGAWVGACPHLILGCTHFREQQRSVRLDCQGKPPGASPKAKRHARREPGGRSCCNVHLTHCRMTLRRAASGAAKAGSSTSTPSTPSAVGTEAEVQRVTSVGLPQWIASFQPLLTTMTAPSDAELLPLLKPSFPFEPAAE